MNEFREPVGSVAWIPARDKVNTVRVDPLGKCRQDSRILRMKDVSTRFTNEIESRTYTQGWKAPDVHAIDDLHRLLILTAWDYDSHLKSIPDQALGQLP
jgi:hypothetical protein